MKKITNILLLVLLFLVIFVPEFKAIVLRGMSHLGIFNANTTERNITDDTLQSHPFQYQDAQGKSYSSLDLEGKIVFLNFWASWCPPCIAEFPDIQNLYETYEHDKDIVFITITLDDDIQKGVQFVQKKKYTLPVYALQSSPSKNWYQGALPTTLVIDTKGNVVFRKENMAQYNTKNFKNFLEGLRKST